jgi:arginyl-tRNA synthetase
MQELQDLIQKAVAGLYGQQDIIAKIERPEPQFGDFTTNVAMQLAKSLGKNPRQIGEEIAQQLRTDIDLITEVTLAGPGFINIKVNDNYYQAIINKVIEQGDNYGRNSTNKGKTILAEYSDPNPLKPLHAGHLYTTLVGDSVARLLEATGAKVIRLNYGGDVGPHVAKTLWAIMRNLGGVYPDRLDRVDRAGRSKWLGERYIEGNNAYEASQDTVELEKLGGNWSRPKQGILQVKLDILAINKLVYDLVGGDDTEMIGIKTITDSECMVGGKEFGQIYWTVRQWSYDYFNELYQQLGVIPFDRVIPESEVVQLGLQTVKSHIPDVYQESDGAIIFKGEDYGLHTRVFINSQGLPTYETKDVGLLHTKWNDYKFDESIILTANEQAQYMQVMIKSVEQYNPELARRSKHVTHGLVKMAGGVKMSSRKGNILTAVDIIESARQANKEITGKDNESAVLAAVKYSFLKQRIGSDIIYDPKESVNVLGNSGPYLQYAYVRAKSILAKAGSQVEPKLNYEPDAPERLLARKLDEFPDIVALASSELMPHHICTYLYELAQEFNRFYEQNKVIGDPREQARLSLLRAYIQVFGNGLQLLGIDKPEKM